MSVNAQFWFNVLTIIAIIAGPIAAIQIQVYLEKRREVRRRKSHVFRELMITRSTVLSPRHVEALNGIQMEFYSKIPEEKKVLDAWQLYITHLNNRSAEQTAWLAQSPELLADLLLEMARCLGYHEFNKVRIKNETYIPQYFADIEKSQNALREAAVKIFSGEKRLKVEVNEPEPNRLQAISPYAPSDR